MPWQAPILGHSRSQAPGAVLSHPAQPQAPLPTALVRARLWLPWGRATVSGRVAHIDWGIIALVLSVVLDSGSPRSWCEDCEPPLEVRLHRVTGWPQL